ncbi:hypothetical protein EVAR_58480_1 [Eumeta japonica]|uniref:Uncharacterized protein n=1 Tax=Eumeta variegata TaxID=151549 RepID=A0A4C1YKN3_EUMVA|nr:hypothetical protein EVAR_58480_1 [Eumeta japonica]
MPILLYFFHNCIDFILKANNLALVDLTRDVMATQLILENTRHVIFIKKVPLPTPRKKVPYSFTENARNAAIIKRSLFALDPYPGPVRDSDAEPIVVTDNRSA